MSYKGQPIVFMMIGVPCAGKSTFISGNSELKDLPIASTDNPIEFYAKTRNKTYDDVFSEFIREATNIMNASVDEFIRDNRSFIWDQTNLTKKSRASKLARIPKHWKKVAVYLETPEKEEWERRLNSRPGKTIPKHVLESMLTQLEPPNLVDENFDRILSNSPMDKSGVKWKLVQTLL